MPSEPSTLIFEKRVIPLAKEYTEKLQEVVKSLADFSKEIQREEITNSSVRFVDYAKLGYMVERAKNILPAAHDLAQAMSQHIEHSSASALSKLEIRLRLAELESTIHSLERIMNGSNFDKYAYSRK